MLKYLESVAEGEAEAFADDAMVSSTGKTVAEATSRLNTILARLVEWVDQSSLALNREKCVYMVLTTSHRKKHVESSTDKVKLGDHELQREECVRYLGVQIDQHLSWLRKPEKHHTVPAYMAELVPRREATREHRLGSKWTDIDASFATAIGKRMFATRLMNLDLRLPKPYWVKRTDTRQVLAVCYLVILVYNNKPSQTWVSKWAVSQRPNVSCPAAHHEDL
ncbi:hypothetical protein RvY_05649 [Ramazzottius varieornatus]|uniref:Reverse transcriptase domain-containing protein n=1 Tax=Ramazzottius varieornatus TaxID=947166 RepID=A0A1D1V5I7_RAMVA|nr:hypothetical protein RvY_05649 [Ramazzottius varieornatus]